MCTGSSNGAPTLHGGGADGKALFSPFEVGKTLESPLGLSVSTNFVTDCSLGVGCRVFPSMLG